MCSWRGCSWRGYVGVGERVYMNDLNTIIHYSDNIKCSRTKDWAEISKCVCHYTRLTASGGLWLYPCLQCHCHCQWQLSLCRPVMTNRSIFWQTSSCIEMWPHRDPEISPPGVSVCIYKSLLVIDRSYLQVDLHLCTLCTWANNVL